MITSAINFLYSEFSLTNLFEKEESIEEIDVIEKPDIEKLDG